MKGYVDNIEALTLANKNFRKVLYTAKFCQLVLMSLEPKQEIGEEIHDGDQFFRFEKGEAKVIIDGVEYLVKDGSAIIVPAGAKHNVVNTSESQSLKLYTIYAPPHHRDQTIHPTKENALGDKEHFEGKTTE